MLAEGSDGSAAKSLIERLPDILHEAGATPLALVALIVLVLAAFSFFLFKKAREKDKLMVFRIVVASVLVLALVVIVVSSTKKPPLVGGNSSNQVPVIPPQPPDCKVSGFVYDEDRTPAAGIQNVKLAYRASSPTNSTPVQMATTSPKGHFSFNCSQIDPAAFPIHLRATFGAGHVIESDDTLLFGENSDVNLYVSPRAISNYCRFNKTVMRIPSAQLLKGNYSELKDTAPTSRVPISAVVAIPRSTLISRDAIARLRTNR